MEQGKKYYYLKLKENFFDTDEMKVLESMPNGYLYSNILLKMYLKSLKNNGELIFREAIPYNVDMLSTITGHNRDIVQQALNIFQKLNLIDILEDGKIYMLDVQTMIGKITSEGIRKAEYRKKIEIEKSSGTELGQCPDIISISISNSNSNSISNSKSKYGEYKHILLKDEEYNKLIVDYGEDKTKEAIKYLDEAIEMKGYKYKSHYLAMRKWVFDALKEKKVNQPKQKESFEDEMKRVAERLKESL